MAATITVKDSVTFTLLKSHLTEKKVDEYLETPERHIPCSDDFKWYVWWFSSGRTNRKELYIYLNAKDVIDARMSFVVDGSVKNWPVKKMSDVSDGWIQYATETHEQLLPLFKNDMLSITVHVEFDITVPLAMHVKPHLFESCEHVPADFELVVGSDRLPVHKSFLSLISPVFHAMFSHDTAESRTGNVEITDVDFGTVKAGVDFCYGRQLPNPTIESVINVLRFADKYDIKAITNPLERIPMTSMSTDSFCAIAKYAYDCSKQELLTECNTFYKYHEDNIKSLEQFGKLPLTLVIQLLKDAFSLNTDFDVLRHAHKTGLMFVVTYLEQPLLDSLTLEDFCPTVKYAWEYSRDNLKIMCAKFLNEHRLEVTTKNEFVNLSAEVVRDVLKLSLTV